MFPGCFENTILNLKIKINLIENKNSGVCHKSLPIFINPRHTQVHFSIMAYFIDKKLVN